MSIYTYIYILKYKQQITVFIVGQAEAIERKNIILAQLNDVIRFKFLIILIYSQLINILTIYSFLMIK